MRKHPNTAEQRSIWLTNFNAKKFPKLSKNLETEVCIIGAGISGLTAAYLLIKEGYKVVIIEKDRILNGDTGKTSAHLSNALDDRYYNIVKVHGDKKAKLAAASHAAAITFIEDTIKKEKIKCDFARVKGYLFTDKSKLNEIKKEYAATEKLRLKTQIGTLPDAIINDTRKCLEFDNQAQFHPIKYLQQLTNIITKKGGVIYEQAQANDIDLETNIIKLANNKKITAQIIIQTSNFPIACSIFINTKIESYRSYVLGLTIPKNALEKALYWDNEEPYHYIRLQENDGSIKDLQDNEEILIVGGADHRVGFEPKEDPYQTLEKWVRNKMPAAKKVLFQWSGQILEPVDYLAYIGHTLGAENKNNYMITGDSGNGLTHGTLGAMLVVDMINGKANKWKSVYDPKRMHLSSIKDSIANLSKSTMGYTGYLTPGEVNSVKDIPRDRGGIVRKGTHKIAAYRDQKGKLYEFSAVCPHLQAIISWNSIDKTWDCPAHGSRFTPEGKLINGPATCDLKCIYKTKK